jgi:hypothetical protein
MQPFNLFSSLMYCFLPPVYLSCWSNWLYCIYFDYTYKWLSSHSCLLIFQFHKHFFNYKFLLACLYLIFTLGHVSSFLSYFFCLVNDSWFYFVLHSLFLLVCLFHFFTCVYVSWLCFHIFSFTLDSCIFILAGINIILEYLLCLWFHHVLIISFIVYSDVFQSCLSSSSIKRITLCKKKRIQIQIQTPECV